MVCGKCRYVNRDSAEVCKYCGAPLKQKREVKVEIPAFRIDTKKKEERKVTTGKIKASSLSIETEADHEEARELSRSRAFTAIVISLGVLVTAGIAILGVLIFSKSPADVPAAAAVSPTVAATPSTSPSPSPSSTQIPTTTPEPTEDISSVFARPSDTIIGE